jgi:hypothetical protein
MRSLLGKKALLGAASVLVLVWIIVGGRGRAGADDPPPPPSDPLAEPITGVVVMPEPGAETGPLQPFQPPPHDSRDVPVEDLSEEDQAYVAAGVDVTGWDDIHAGFATATAEAAADAAAQAAANELGIAGFADTGVVP